MPVFAIGLVTMLLSFASAAATTLAVKSSTPVKAVKGPPQAVTEPKGKDKPHGNDKKAGEVAPNGGSVPSGNDAPAAGEPTAPKGQDEPKAKDEPKTKVKDNAKSKPDAGEVTKPSGNSPAKPDAQVVTNEAPSSATAVTPVPPQSAVPPTETVGTTTGSGSGKLDTRSTKGSRQRTANRSRRSRGASAGSGLRPSSAPLAVAVAASRVHATKTTSRSAKAKRHRAARRSVVERIVDRVPAAYRFGLLGALALAAGFAFATFRQGRRARRAEAEALVDSLTGLANRRAFDRRLAEEWNRSERYGRPLGVVILDLDGFKQLNDTRGHKEGDRVLREAASRLNERVRGIDLAARLGGDEFAALCPETPYEGLDALVHSLKHCLEGLPVGASIGFAEREPTDENPLDLLERADVAMYGQKRLAPAAR